MKKAMDPGRKRNMVHALGADLLELEGMPT